MKKSLFFSLVCMLMAMMILPSYAQAPQSFKYQSIARNSSGLPIANDNIGLRIGIHDGSATGTLVYQETHLATTNAFGLFTISVGGGTPVSGSFSGIDWGTGEKFIEVEADFNGGTSYIRMGASQLLSVPYALYSSNGTPGPAGADGATGPQGSAGPQGTPGNDGADGLNVLNGTSDPTGDVGVDGEFFINTATNMLFGPKAGGAWPAGISLIGPQGIAGADGADGATGAQGPAGNDGEDGLNVLNGATDPTGGVGIDGEFFINTATNMLFGPKAAGAWPTGISLIGPQGVAGADGADGATGPQGPAGNDGAAGINGLNVLNGATDPTGGDGVDGEFYINTTSNTLFGPKASGAWPAGVLLVGPQGTAGSDGLNVLNGASDPTGGDGVDGEFYINTTSNTLFGPKASGSWPAGVSLIGPTGPQGATGLLTPGSIAGNTPYWDGSNWIANSSNIFNAGGDVGIGTATPGAKLDVAGSVKITDGSEGVGKVLTSDVNGLASWTTPGSGGWGLTGNAGTSGANFIGTIDNVPLSFRVNNQKAGRIEAAGAVLLGYQAGNSNTANYVTGVGYQALNANISGNENTAIGSYAMFWNTTGSSNTATGYLPLYSNTTGSANTAFGYFSLMGNTTGNGNIGIGVFSARNNSTGGQNIAIGYSALAGNTTGSYNTAVGDHADVSTDNLTNATAIGNGAIVNASNTIQLGDANVTQVFAGTGTNATLVTGGLQVTGGTPAAGKVLTSDASGVATWQDPAASGGSIGYGQKFWATQSFVSAVGIWTTIPNSDLSIVTNGGPLMINTNIYMSGSGATATCQPIVDGVWAGTYSSMSDPSSNGIQWREGLITLTTGWQSWSTTRIYPGIPAGSHTIEIQCSVGGSQAIIGHTSINCSYNYVELGQ